MHPTTPRRRTARPRLEALEDRTTPATFTVTGAGDPGGPGTLRDAIAQAEAAPDADTIVFAPSLAWKEIHLDTVGDTQFGPSALLVSTPITITGTGQTIQRTGAPGFRLFAVK